MIRMHRRISGAVTVLTMAALILTGCTSEASSISSAKNKDGGADAVDTGFTMSTVGSYDSADTAVVLSTDETNKAVTFINMETGKQYTLYYDGTTYVKDKYDGPMTISQIEPGDVVDVTFLKGKKRLASIKKSPDAWVYDNVYNYDLTGANRTASIGSQSYSLPESAVVLSEGRRVDKAEVVSQDVVTISGIDHKIYSVSVDKGHGYLRLKNDQPLLGGWIEVGNNTIRQITEDMLLVVPEGSYQVVLTNKNVGCVKEVTVERNKEVVLDVSDLEVAEDAVGKILFSVTPENATVSVDNEPVDISKVVELSYGIHRVEAAADGYDTLTKHIQVGSEYATITFKLEETPKPSSDRDTVSVNSIPKEEKEPFEYEDTYKPIDSISANSVSKSVSENALGTSNNNKVYVDAPKDVEVYLDGNYVGISPVRFSKTAGRHEITLRKDGYESKTYTIYLENDKRDETYSFSELVKKSAVTTVGRQIPAEILGAISGISGCTLKDGEGVLVAGTDATLQDSGIKTIKDAVRDVVQRKIGEAEEAKFTIVVQPNLSNVIPPKAAQDGQAVENGSASATVTLYRDGYKDQNVSFPVAIEGQAEGEPTPPTPEKNITVEVTPDQEEVEAGDSVTFSAGVKDNGEIVSGATVSWTYSDADFNGMVIEEESALILQVDSVEETVEFTATATYTDADGESHDSAPAKVTIIKTSEEEPDPDDGDNNEEGKIDPPPSIDPNQSGTETPSGTSNTGTLDNTKTEMTDNPVMDEKKETAEKTNSSNGLTEEEVTMTQNAHPIRNFFSSLFKK